MRTPLTENSVPNVQHQLKRMEDVFTFIASSKNCIFKCYSFNT